MLHAKKALVQQALLVRDRSRGGKHRNRVGTHRFEQKKYSTDDYKLAAILQTQPRINESEQTSTIGNTRFRPLE